MYKISRAVDELNFSLLQLRKVRTPSYFIYTERLEFVLHHQFTLGLQVSYVRIVEFS